MNYFQEILLPFGKVHISHDIDPPKELIPLLQKTNGNISAIAEYLHPEVETGQVDKNGFPIYKVQPLHAELAKFYHKMVLPLAPIPWSKMNNIKFIPSEPKNDTQECYEKAIQYLTDEGFIGGPGNKPKKKKTPQPELV